MKLVFHGTRGYIEPIHRRHRMHTVTEVSYLGRRVLVDCGESWRGRLPEPAPHAIVLTHAHPDHADGLRDGAPCPVYATRDTWDRIARFPIARELRHELRPRRPRRIEGIRFEAFPVVHFDRAPTVGYRIAAGRVAIFYVPDVVEIPNRHEALAGARLYVGDGATIARPIIRRSRLTGQPVGHTPIRTQIEWCRDAGVPRFVVTHCGSQIVGGDERVAAARLCAMGAEAGVDVQIAHDAMTLMLR